MKLNDLVGNKDRNEILGLENKFNLYIKKQIERRVKIGSGVLLVYYSLLAILDSYMMNSQKLYMIRFFGIVPSIIFLHLLSIRKNFREKSNASIGFSLFLLNILSLLMILQLKNKQEILTYFSLMLASILMNAIILMPRFKTSILIFFPFFILNETFHTYYTSTFFQNNSSYLISFHFLPFMTMSVILLFSFMFEKKQKDLFLYKKIQEYKEELEQKETEINKLSEMLPLCSNCKRIRDDEGYWNEIEEYIEKHADIKFTHGLCNECISKLYPEIDQKQNQ